MDNINYLVKTYIQSESSNINDDDDVGNFVFKPISTTQFSLAIKELEPINQSLKVHIEVVQL